ncbi:MAG: HAMP domain-containing histidine kinase [Verrucomicrobiota bacterium]|nr:HAMP domain-containing histidine kinase [Verrucomicrobiota bacterium]
MFWKQLREFSRTLSFRLNLWHATIFLASTALLSALLYFLLSRAIDYRDRDILQARLREYIAVEKNGGIDALRDWTTRVNQARRKRMFFVRVARSDGEVLLVLLPEDWSERDVKLIDDGSHLRAEKWLRMPRDSESDLTIASEFLPDGTIFQVGRTSDSRGTLLTEFLRVFAVVIPPALLLGFVGGAILTNRLTRPLRSVVGTASSIIKTGRLDVRVPERKASDELNDLVVLFNQLLDHNERLISAQRESLDNVAHDLRTPLARLRATLEHSLNDRRIAKERGEELAEAIEETDQVLTVIRTIMDVAQAESGIMKLHRASADVRQLVENVVDLYDAVAQEKGVALATHFNGELAAELDSARMSQVLANLLDNAVKYTPRGGSIDISAARDNGQVEITFRDDGPGIMPNDLPRIWERLYRGDKSRSEDGLGLGLSLVKAIVEAHDGRVAARNRDGRGAEFRITIPA